MSRRVDRRRFLQQAAAGMAGMGCVGLSSAALRAGSTDDRIRLAGVGVGNKGAHNLDELSGQELVALCDVDEQYLQQAAARFPGARLYRDYRRMLDAEANRIDAVVVSTADHTHAPIASAALDLGKHVYCEKPLTHTVREARVLAELAQRNRLATQMGTQIHASDNYRRVVEWIQAGLVGEVREVYTWCNKGWSDGRFQLSQHPAPAHLDWDLWLGPATARGYCDNVHPANWRRFWEFGSGTFGDMACHIMDLPFWALKLRHPTRVACEGPERHPEGAPAWTKSTYHFPGAGTEPLTLHWSDGGAHFDTVTNTLDHGGRPLSEWGLGVLFVGSRGMLAADYGRRQLLPQDAFQGVPLPEPSIPASTGHWNEWVAACRSGGPTSCNFDYSGALTEAVLLGIVAYRCGQPIEWDAEKLRVTNTSAAEEFVTKDYRSGFELVTTSK